MTADHKTLRVYAAEAERYRALVSRDTADQDLQAFLDALAPGAHVLDLGSGPGNAAAMIQAAGFTVEAWDAAPEMVALAKAAGVPARTAGFDDLTARAAYDAIWANFSLLHARRADLPRHLAAIARALRPGGLFHIGMKTGTGAGRDRLGRYYTYVGVAELKALLTDAGLTPLASREGEAAGLSGEVAPFVILRARAP